MKNNLNSSSSSSSSSNLVQIKHRFSGDVLFQVDAPEDVLKEKKIRFALEKAADNQVSLHGADLSGAYLPGSDLRGYTLSVADLSGSNLFEADLRGANLSWADLSGANLYGADLMGADLTGANLTGANLFGANLVGAILSGARLVGSELGENNFTSDDGKILFRSTPEQAIENLDKVRTILMNDSEKLGMDSWHTTEGWKDRTPEEETLCGTTHCLAGWLQVCSSEPAVRGLDPELAGLLLAPVAAKMFFRSSKEVLSWLENREYAKGL